MIKHTKQYTPSMWMRSRGGLGETYQEEVTRITWEDGTKLTVRETSAYAEYKGQKYILKHVDGDHDKIVAHWEKLITIRLAKDIPPSTRLQDRVKNWNTDTSRLAK